MAAALAVTAPLLAPGFVLTYDLAFVPRPPISTALVGLGTGVPRGVPFGLLSTLLARAIGGQAVEKLLLVVVVFVAMLSAARLVPSDRPAARIAAGLSYAWNPFVYERLLLGQVPFLLSYALLPVVAGAALRLRRGERLAGAGVAGALALASFASSYGGVLAVGLAVAVAAWPPRRGRERPLRAAAVALGAGLVLNLPWLVPAALRPGGLPSPSLGFELFRSRPDSPLGVAGSLLSLGGLWRTDLAPPGRGTVAWVPAFVLLLAAAAWGFPALARRWPAGAVAGLVAAAAVGFALALGVNLPGVGAAVRWAGVHLPGGGILRDGQKFVAPFAVLLSVSFGLGVERALDALRTGPAPNGTGMAPYLRSRDQASSSGRPVDVWRHTGSRGVVAVAVAALPLALAPSLAWGASGRLFNSRYPPSWGRAGAAMAADPAPGAVLVLPWHLYLPFGWNRDRPVIQPASLAFTRPAVVGDALEVGRARLPGEDPWSRLADPAVRGRGSLVPSLPRLGVRYVLVFHEADWRAAAGRLAGLEPVLRAPDLDLYRSRTPAAVPSFPEPPAAPVLAGDVLAAAAAAWAGIALAAARLRRDREARRPNPGTGPGGAGIVSTVARDGSEEG